VRSVRVVFTGNAARVPVGFFHCETVQSKKHMYARSSWLQECFGSSEVSLLLSPTKMRVKAGRVLWKGYASFGDLQTKNDLGYLASPDGQVYGI
jgi:hypothetical protein